MNKKSILYMVLPLAAVVVLWWACTPEKGSPLGTPAQASFSMSGGGDNNTVVLTNTATSGIPYWSVNGGSITNGNTDTVSFIFAGTYSVTEYLESHGGLYSMTQQVTINNNNPTACAEGVQGFLSGCGGKSWSLDPIAAAEGVGPSPDNTTWWGNGATEPTTDRVCDWAATWQFQFNPAFTLVYNNQGSIYADAYIGLSDNACEPNSDVPANQQAWLSGTFSYKLIPGKGSNPALGQLEVVGLGAHIGVAKVQNSGDATTNLPVASTTYDIWDTATDAQGHGILTLVILAGSTDWWTVVLRSN